MCAGAVRQIWRQRCILTNAILVLLFVSAVAVRANSETDVFLDDGAVETRPFKLQLANENKAESMALFARGLFDQESKGPEAALESYRKVLALDPGYTGLAVHVAQEYLRRGEAPQAIVTLKDSLKANPQSPVASIALAKIYLLNLRKPDLAESFALKALAASPETIEPYESLWDIYQYAGQRKKADQVLARAALSSSTDPLFWLELAALLQRQVPIQSDPLSAEPPVTDGVIAKAVELGFTQPRILNKAAEYYFLSGQLVKAAPLYERILKLDPEFSDVLEKLAGAYMGTAEYTKALPIFQKLIEENPQQLGAYDQLAILYRAKDDLPKSLEAMQKGLLLAPYMYERHVAIIGLLLDLQRFETALIYVNDAVEKFPQASLLTYLRAITLSRLKRATEAMPLYARAQVEGGNQSGGDFRDAMFYFEYGMAAEQSEHYDKAAELFKKSIELDPANAARTSNYLGYMWVERGENLDEAETLIRRAIKSEPDNGAYIDSLGWLYFKKGKYADALVELLRAAELLPQPDAVVYEHVGDAYRELGRNPEALLYWQKAALLDPENKSIAQKIDQSAKKMASKP